MTLNNDAVSKMVNDLVAKVKENEEFYQTAAKNAVNDELQELLRGRAQQRAEFIEALASATWQEHDERDVDDGVTSAVQRGLMTVKAAMTIERDKTDEVVLADSQKAEERLLEEYQAALSPELPPGLRALIKEQYNQVQAAYAYVGASFVESQERAVLGLFTDIEAAQQALQALQEAGFDHGKIGLLAQDDVVQKALGDDKVQAARDSAGAAALGGGAVGGLIGLAAGLSIPIVFPMLAAGALAAAVGVTTAAGVGIGASYGGILGALLGWGVAEDDTHRYIESVRRGEVLVAVQSEANRADEAAAILRRFNGRDVATRHEELELKG